MLGIDDGLHNLQVFVLRSCVSLSTLHPCLLNGKSSYSNNEQNLYIIISFCFVQTAVVIKKCSLRV